MRRTLAVCTCAFALLLALDTARAQEADPPTRYVTATSVQVPFNDRADFLAFLEEYFLPGIQLNPRVRNFRMLNHNWGSNGETIVLVAEYESFADIEAECGAPCDEYYAQHEEPEEGADGYDEYAKKLEVFNKYYSSHSDEIYSTNMNRAVVEGEMQGSVGPTPPAAE